MPEPTSPTSPLRDARTALGIAPAAVADRLGVSVAMAYHWETGHSVPPLPRAMELARLLLGLPSAGPLSVEQAAAAWRLLDGQTGWVAAQREAA